MRRICSIIFKREFSGIHIHHVGTEEHPAVSQRRIGLQHSCMGFQIRVAARTARSPVVMLQRDINILLAIQIGGITAHAAFQPVIILIVPGFIGEFVIAGGAGWRYPGCHHRVFIAFQRGLRLPLLYLETRRITQHQRAFHGRRQPLRLRHNFAECFTGSVIIPHCRLDHRYPALGIDRPWRSRGCSR